MRPTYYLLNNGAIIGHYEEKQAVRELDRVCGQYEHDGYSVVGNLIDGFSARKFGQLEHCIRLETAK